MRALPVFLVLIPAIIALGNDIYLFTEVRLADQMFSIDLLMEKFKFSALGFIWTHYDIDSYKAAVDSMPAEDWAKIDKLLTFKAFHLTIGFAVIMIILFYILKMFGIGPFVGDEEAEKSISFSKMSKKASKDSFRAGAGSKKVKYKRK